MAPYRVAGLFLAIGLFFLSPGSTRAGFEEGVAAYERGDYGAAMREFMPLAVAGNSTAQYNLAVMYDRGEGVAQNYAEAARWYRLAGEQGLAAAQFNLGQMYRRGEGLPQNDAEAVRWYRLAADQGDTDAQHNLGLAYARGRGVPQDDVRAYMWLNLAAARSPQGEDRTRTVELRDEVAARLSPAQRARARTGPELETQRRRNVKGRTT